MLTRDGEPVALGSKVVETLLALFESPGDVLAKGVLLDRIWPEGFVDEANLAQNVHGNRERGSTLRGAQRFLNALQFDSSEPLMRTHVRAIIR